MNKRFIIRLLGFVIVLADGFFMLYIWHSAALAKYIVSSVSASVGSLSVSLQANGGEFVYASENLTIDSLSEALKFLGAGAGWVYLILILGLVFCIVPQWFVKLFDLGATKISSSNSESHSNCHSNTNTQ